jgi:hypothetical protein
MIILKQVHSLDEGIGSHPMQVSALPKSTAVS